MAVRTASFNARQRASAGLAVSHSRPYAVTTAAGGTLAAAGEIEYGAPRLVLAPPTVVTLDTDATALNQVFSGTWSDGSPCVVQIREKASPNGVRVNIWVNPTITTNCFTSNPGSRSVDIRCTATGNKTTALQDLLKGTPDEDAAWVYYPKSMTIVRGVIIAACVAQNYTGGSWQASAIAFCQWDEANSRWKLLFRGKTRNVGQDRGREWIGNQYWILDGGTLDTTLEVMLCWADYASNPNGNGGQLHVCRLSRADTASAFTVGSIVMVHEATNSGSHHFHNAFAYRPTPVAGAASGPIVIALSVGDSGMAEFLAFTRADSSAYAEGWDAGTKNATASATDAATSNGWTTRRKLAGTPSTLSSSPAVGFNQFMGVAPVNGAPSGSTRFVCGNDEGANSLIMVDMPDLISAGTSKPIFRTMMDATGYQGPGAQVSFRRGWLAFGVWCDTSNRRDYIAVQSKNSGSQSLGATTLGDGSQVAISWNDASVNHQGFSGQVGNAANRVLYSPDGINWGVLWCPNAAVRPCVMPSVNGSAAWALIGGISSFGKVVGIQLPGSGTGSTRAAVRRPAKIGPAPTNYLISTLTAGDGTATGNTRDLTVGSKFGVADAIVTGRTIPAPPCNGPALRWTVDGASGATSKYAGTFKLTTGTPITAITRPGTGQNVVLKFWVYLLPPSTSYTENVAPYSSTRTAFRLQLGRQGSSAFSYSQLGDVDSVDGTGWVPFTFDTNTSEWGADSAGSVDLYIRLTDSGSGATNMDVLIAFESLSISADKATGTDAANHALPVGAAATTNPGSIADDRLAVSGLRGGAAWTALMAVQVPENCWDQYMLASRLAANRRLCTLAESSDRFIKILVDLANVRLQFIDQGAATINLAAASGERFVFDRKAMLWIGLSQLSGTLYAAASVGGSSINTGSVSLTRAIALRDVIMADALIAPVMAADWHAVQVDEMSGYNASNLSAALAAWARGGNLDGDSIAGGSTSNTGGYRRRGR